MKHLKVTDNGFLDLHSIWTINFTFLKQFQIANIVVWFEVDFQIMFPYHKSYFGLIKHLIFVKEKEFGSFMVETSDQFRWY